MVVTVVEATDPASMVVTAMAAVVREEVLAAVMEAAKAVRWVEPLAVSMAEMMNQAKFAERQAVAEVPMAAVTSLFEMASAVMAVSATWESVATAVVVWAVAARAAMREVM